MTIKDYQKQKEKEQVAYNYFLNNGYSPEASAGIVGNLVYESNLNTKAEGDIGYSGGSSRGIGQFRGARLQGLKKRYGDNWTDFGNQLDYVRHELETTHKNAGNGLKNAKNAYEAGQVFSDLYEIPAKKYKNNLDRQKKVNKIYSSYAVQSATPTSNALISIANQYFSQTPTTDLTELDNTEETANFTPETEEPVKEDKDIQEVKKQTAEYNFLKDYQDIVNQKPVETIVQEENIAPQQPSPDLTQIYNNVSNFIDSDFAQQGGQVRDNIPNLQPNLKKDSGLTPQAYLESYLQSPVYLERLRRQGYPQPQTVVDYRLNRLQDVDIYDNTNSNSLEKFYKDLKGYPNIYGGSSAYSNDSNKVTMNSSRDNSMIPKEETMKKDYVQAHELSHATVSGIPLNYSDRYELLGRQKDFQLDEDFRKQDLEDLVKNYSDKLDHDSQPKETKADIDALRYMLYKRNIYDTRTDGKFNQWHLNQLNNSNDAIKNRLKRTYEDKDIIWLMNNIADNSNDNSVYSQQGGTIGNLTPEQTLDVESKRQWLNNWNSNRVINGEKINSNSDIPFSSDIYTDDLNYGNNGIETTLGEFDNVSDRLILDTNYQSKAGIPVHELSHRYQKYLNPETYNKYINTPISKELLNTQGSSEYHGNVDENQAELNRLRYNSQFKPDQIITPSDLKNYNAEDYNLKHFSQDQLINLLNTTAYNPQVNNDVYAQQGGFVRDNIPNVEKKEIKDLKVDGRSAETFGNLVGNLSDYFLGTDSNPNRIESSYKPTQAQDKDIKYYTYDNIKNDVVKNLTGDQLIKNKNSEITKYKNLYKENYKNKTGLGTDFQYTSDFKNIYDYYKNATNSMKSAQTGSGINLGQYRVTSGEDSKGKYISIHDTYDWDILGAIAPKGWEIYDRIYEQEFNEVKNKLPKRQQGGKIIKDQQGQRNHPHEITQIEGNIMSTEGYGNIPLYVVPDIGSPRIVYPNTGEHIFEGASNFIEYPVNNINKTSQLTEAEKNFLKEISK